MKKLRFMVIILSFLLIFTACKKSNDSINISEKDSLQTVNDTTITQNDPIWDDSPVTDNQETPAKQDTVIAVQDDDWEYGISGINNQDNRSSLGGAIVSNKGVSATEIAGRSVGSLRRSGNANIEELTAIAGNDADVTRGRISSRSNIQSQELSMSGEMDSAPLGYSVGGAKDVNNFRENIKNNYMPIEQDITHEGIFYDYFFDNNITKKAKHLFEPAYTSSKTRHPLTNEEELYLSVGLNSNLTENSFKRKKLNLTIVLDISGSMSSSFRRYYYDGGVRKGYGKDYDGRSKMEIAKKCIIDLTKHLKSGDRFAVVLFDNQSHLAKPLNLVNNTNMKAIREHIDNIQPQGGTNMYAGINTASELYQKLPKYDSKEYDNRIIFLTDAMPNTDVTNENSLWGVMKVNAERKIYTTFVGVGVDLNSELINYITKTPGANYYSVHDADEFKKRMDTQFDYMVTPLVFDLTLHLESKNYDIEAVYGSPEADQATGEIMKVNTLFPSESEDGKTRGGIILIKLKKKGNASDDIKLTCSYKDRNGVPYLNSENITFSKNMRGSDNGIRKAVLLSRYVNLMHNWINNIREEDISGGEDDWTYNKTTPKPRTRYRNQWERRSTKLEVNSYYEKQFTKFKNHFAKEATSIKDDDLRQELDILEKLIDGSYTKNNESSKKESNVDINIMPDNFFGKWYDTYPGGVWRFGITKEKFRTGNRFYNYQEINYDKKSKTYMIKIAKSGDERTYYFRFENDKSMYYSGDNKNFKRVAKKN